MELLGSQWLQLTLACKLDLVGSQRFVVKKSRSQVVVLALVVC